jgi:poly(ADP-ribose) glycohydrolase ARH3
MDTEGLADRFRGALLGVAAGDALGAPFEGRPRVDPAAVRAWAGADQPLRWTDDTLMTIGLASSLLARRGFDGAHMAATLADDHAAQPWRGYGPGPPQVFAALREGVPWDEAPRRLFGGSGSRGNGAAMRVAPVGLVHHGDPRRAARLARRTASVTHAHELGLQGAALQAAAVAWLVDATLPPVPAGLLDAVRPAAPAPAFQRRLDALERIPPDWSPERVAETLGNGVEATRSVPAALHAFLRNPRSFSRAVCHAVTLGGDTDTIAAMTGALAGAALGASAIPGAWRARLEEPDRLERLAEELLACSSA